MTAEECAGLAGSFLDEESFDELIQVDADVWKPDGSPLIRFRKGALNGEEVRAGYRNLRGAAKRSENRGIAAGSPTADRVPTSRRKGFRLLGKNRYTWTKEDGTVSNTVVAVPVNSGVVGFYDRYPRQPYCRETAFNIEHPEKFASALPFINGVDRVFRENHPERWRKQRSACERTSPDFVIGETAFTTITVNRNWQTAVHQDAGDYWDGYGVMASIRAGNFGGYYLVFPRFRVAVDMRTSDVLLADVHEWHGNTPPRNVRGRHERFSFVFYYREGMDECGSAAQELERASKLGVRCKT